MGTDDVKTDAGFDELTFLPKVREKVLKVEGGNGAEGTGDGGLKGLEITGHDVLEDVTGGATPFTQRDVETTIGDIGESKILKAEMETGDHVEVNTSGRATTTDLGGELIGVGGGIHGFTGEGVIGFVKFDPTTGFEETKMLTEDVRPSGGGDGTNQVPLVGKVESGITENEALKEITVHEMEIWGDITEKLIPRGLDVNAVDLSIGIGKHEGHIPGPGAYPGTNVENPMKGGGINGSEVEAT